MSSGFRSPLSSPQAEPKAGPSPTPSVPSQAADRLLPTPEEPGSWFQILQTDTKAILSPPHRHPSSKEGEVLAALGCCHPAVRPCHTLPNPSATSRLPDISGPRSPQQQFGVVRAALGGLRRRRPPSRRLGSSPRGRLPSLRSPVRFPTALAAASLPESPDPLQAARRRPRPSLSQPPPRPCSHTRGPRATRGQPTAAHSPHCRRPGPGAATPLGCSLGCAGEPGLRPSACRPPRSGRLVSAFPPWSCPGSGAGAEPGGRPQNNDLPHARGSTLPPALVAGACVVKPGTPSARCVAECAQQGSTAPSAPPRACSLLLPRPPHSLRRRSPKPPQPTPVAFSSSVCHATPSSPAAILTPE